MKRMREIKETCVMLLEVLFKMNYNVDMQNEQSIIAQNIEEMLKIVEERKLEVDETVRAKDELEHDLNKYESKVEETKTKLSSLDEEAAKISTDHTKIDELNARIDHAEYLFHILIY